MSMWIPAKKEFGGRRPCPVSVDGTRSVIDRQADDLIMWQNCGARGGWHSLGSRTSTAKKYMNCYSEAEIGILPPSVHSV